MNISNIISHLNSNTTSFTSIYEPTLGGFDIPVNSSSDLFTVLNSTITTLPNSAEVDTALPHMVYRVMGVNPIEVDGYRVAQTDEFGLLLRASTYSSLRTLTNSVINLLGSGDYAVEASDLQTYYDPDFGADGCHVAELMIDVTYTTASSSPGPTGTLDATLPLLMVYPISRDAGPMDDMNIVHQQVINQYAFVVVTQGNDIYTLLDELQEALLGYQVSSEHEGMHYLGGANLVGVKPMTIWREMYQNYYWIEETT